MPQANDAVAALLNEYAELHLMTGGDQFRARSYEKAARAVAGHAEDVSGMSLAELRRIPGVGQAIAGKITEINASGTFAALERLRADIPEGVLQLTRIPALGPKRALVLYRERHVGSPEELRDAIKEGRLAGLRGFGSKSEEKLLQGIKLLESTSGRVLLNVADETAGRVVRAVSAVPGCLRCTPAGSLRRFAETVGDVDVLAAADDSGPLMAALTGLPEAAAVIAAGPAKTSVRTAAGLQVDLRVVPLDSWGAALQYFTGSQAHNVAIREIAVRKKLKLSEYGLFDAADGEKIVSRTEEEVYHRLGMSWIPPTLREHAGEIEVAQRGDLPELVTEQDIRGDLHTHTDLTDGVAPLEDMVAKARARGYAYYAITDHAPNLVMQRMTDEKMLAQREQVRLARREPGRPGGGQAHGPAARDRAEHRAGRDRGLARGVPGRLRHLRGLGALALRPVPDGDDPAVHHRLREPVRQRHRPSAGPADRPAAASRCRPARAVPGVREDRHRAGGERAPEPARPAVRAYQGGQGRRGQVRRGQRRPLHRRPGLPALRHRDRPARLAGAR